MGAVCHCGRSSEESYFNEFWGNLPIRNISPASFLELLQKLKKDNLKVSDNKVFEEHLLPLLINPEHRVMSKSLWLEAKNKEWPEYFNQVLLVLFFLTRRDIKEGKEVFIALSKELHPIVRGEESKYFIRAEIEGFLMLYVFLIANYSVEFLKPMAAGKEDEFSKNFHSAFSSDNQTRFLQEHFNLTYKDQTNISVDSFFEKSYNVFTDDVKIREAMFEMWREDMKKKEEKKQKKVKKDGKEEEKDGKEKKKDKKDKKEKKDKKDKK
jgi:hypothetical protein